MSRKGGSCQSRVPLYSVLGLSVAVRRSLHLIHKRSGPWNGPVLCALRFELVLLGHSPRARRAPAPAAPGPIGHCMRRQHSILRPLFRHAAPALFPTSDPPRLCPALARAVRSRRSVSRALTSVTPLASRPVPPFVCIRPLVHRPTHPSAWQPSLSPHAGCPVPGPVSRQAY